MEDTENKGKERGEIFSRAIRAGKRTYFFDVKTTADDEAYLTITESKRRFNEQGKFFYEKHKLFLYKEDFEKFLNGLNDSIEFITTGKAPERPAQENVYVSQAETDEKGLTTERHSIEFEDLTSESENSL
ncbi:MAG: DUF3276 family protein [Bacteroidetes bacterium]|nr:DUF3276 family protein [Bacteroidota bacterium]